MERGLRNEEAFCNHIAWGEDGSFAVYHSIEGDNLDWHVGSVECKISIWRLDAESDVLTQVQTIEVGIGLTALALADNYVAGSSKDKKIHIWDRQTEQKIWSSLCDVGEEDELGEDDCIYPILLSCHGHMLVTTSHIGCVLCVWNMKTGRLLKRHNDADQYVDLLPDGTDVTSMTFLNELNGFLCTTGYMQIWVFPTSSDQRNMALEIRRREDDLRTAWLNENDSDSSSSRSFSSSASESE